MGLTSYISTHTTSSAIVGPSRSSSATELGSGFSIHYHARLGYTADNFGIGWSCRYYGRCSKCKICQNWDHGDRIFLLPMCPVHGDFFVRVFKYGDSMTFKREPRHSFHNAVGLRIHELPSLPTSEHLSGSAIARPVWMVKLRQTLDRALWVLRHCRQLYAMRFQVRQSSWPSTDFSNPN